MNQNTISRLDEIAERNRSSRVVDLFFAAMIALLLIMCVASLRAAAEPNVSRAAKPAAAQLAHLDGCGVDSSVC